MPALYLSGKSDDRTWDPCRNRAEKGQGKSKRIKKPRPLDLFNLTLAELFIFSPHCYSVLSLTTLLLTIHSLCKVLLLFAWTSVRKSHHKGRLAKIQNPFHHDAAYGKD